MKLPDQKITVVHRSEGSGTTFIWTDYLSKVSKEWANGPGKGTSINWPVGIGAKGNENVASMVRQLPGAIGYIELIYALQNHIDFGAVKNASGNWVKASIDGVTAAAATRRFRPIFASRSPMRPGTDAYPISSFTYLLVPLKPIHPENQKTLKDLLSWIIKSGEAEASQLSYAPLPQNCGGQGAARPSTRCPSNLASDVRLIALFLNSALQPAGPVTPDRRFLGLYSPAHKSHPLSGLRRPMRMPNQEADPSCSRDGRPAGRSRGLARQPHLAFAAHGTCGDRTR